MHICVLWCISTRLNDFLSTQLQHFLLEDRLMLVAGRYENIISILIILKESLKSSIMKLLTTGPVGDLEVTPGPDFWQETVSSSEIGGLWAPSSPITLERRQVSLRLIPHQFTLNLGWIICNSPKLHKPFLLSRSLLPERYKSVIIIPPYWWSKKVARVEANQTRRGDVIRYM